ncbi:MAG: hypothetical protein E3J88_06550 [Anaerolineales bacterium]|nr:MAG: hypothetical protein E3J88_06550 [Anaerolineales bacterium]
MLQLGLYGCLGTGGYSEPVNILPATEISSEGNGETYAQRNPQMETNPDPSQEVPTSEIIEKVELWIAPYLPAEITYGLVVPLKLEVIDNYSEAGVHLEVGDGHPLTYLVYALAAPFPTVTDSVSTEDIRRVWFASNDYSGTPLLVSPETRDIFSAWWGPPQGGGVVTMPEGELLAFAWENRPVWVLRPFENLVPKWKVMSVDGVSPIWKDFEVGEYPLSVPVSLSGVDTGPEEVVLTAFESLLTPTFNRHPDKLTTIVMTGVTAMVRATAWEMEVKGITYPAGDVAEMMREADLTHISNEVPFVEKCPYPDPGQSGMIFCSNPEYMALLEEVGTDVVELTGDHFSDWGPDTVLYTLELYAEYGLPYYGGGATPEEGRQAITFEHNGNKIAFIGCNGKGGGYAPGSMGLPGAIDCKFDWLEGEIQRLNSQGYLVIFTFQHNETYSFVPGQQLMREFKQVADYGAKIVSGSQAHQPHSMEFYRGSLLMYGLGNLFFDQLRFYENTDRALIARHVIYDGRHISTELFTVYFIDYSRPRIMSEEDRIQLLIDVFSASGW